ncbi:hypothetical protein SAMN05192533_102293 [Mesobacillus persicus]|uniref:Uncharacterized protein n=1 Tax=Mesobacillus persicus TaxID=930146 RepID=A0A1H7XP16_9BACI|nr:hypothetical protein [Mesobacillus persicus]SEM35373.1 hypothetical protein SAMN05192533_102293 [Mesobacillus persicus]
MKVKLTHTADFEDMQWLYNVVANFFGRKIEPYYNKDTKMYEGFIVEFNSLVHFEMFVRYLGELKEVHEHFGICVLQKDKYSDLLELEIYDGYRE